jgi:hypothetical protein
MDYAKKIVPGLSLIALCISLSLMLIQGHQQKQIKELPVPSSGPVNLLDLVAITRGSDLIAVGQVITISDEGPTEQNEAASRMSGRQMVAYLQVDRVLKGPNDNSDLSFHFFTPELGSTRYSGVSLSQYGMFFLRDLGSRQYILVDATYPSVAAAPRRPTVSATATEFEVVVAEVAQVLESSQANPDDRVRAVWALEFVKTRSAIEALRRAAKDANISIRSQAMASLFRHNDITLLDEAVDTMLNPSPDVSRNIVGGLGDSIRAGVTDPRAVPALTRLLSSQNPADRRNAAETLNRTGPAGVAALTRALDDSDQRVRYAAVTGLARLTGETDAMPSLELFQKHEQHYLIHWRERIRKKN